MRINLLLIIFLMSSLASAQDIDLKWSKTETYTAKSPEPEIVGLDEENIILLKGKDYDYMEDYWIDIYDRNTFSLKFKIDFSTPQFKNIRKNEITRIYYKDKKITIFSSFREYEKQTIFGTIINIDGSVIELMKEIDGIDNYDKKLKGSISILNNKEKDRYLIATDIPSNKKENETLRYKIFDNNLKQYSNKTITLPYKANLFDIEANKIDSRGNVYLIGTKYETKADKNNNNGTSLIFVYSIEKEEFNEFKFPVVHNLMWGYSLTFDDEDNLKIEGRYSDNIDENNKDEGIFTLLVETKLGKVIENKVWPITPNLIPKELKDYAFGNQQNNKYSLRNIFNISEDKKVAIMEDFSAYTYCTNYGCQETSIFKNMLVLYMNNSGKVESIKVIPKSQQLSINVGASLFINFTKRNSKFRALTSFTPIVNEKNIFLLYNDHNKNLDRSLPKKFKVTSFGKETACYIAQVNVDGSVKRDILFKKKDEGGFLITPGNSVQISESEVLVFANQIKNRELKFGIISVNK